MQKICENCFEIYRGTEPIEFCPKRGCLNTIELVEADDMMVDILIGFWAAGIQTLFSCAGHLYYQESFPFEPHITFFAYQGDDAGDKEYNDASLADLKELRAILGALNKNNEFDIGEIRLNENHAGYEFKLSCKISKKADLTARDRLKIQNEFLNFLYDALEAIRGSENA